MRRTAVVAFALAAGPMLAGPVWGATRQASIGNYYYEDDTTGSRTQIKVRQGDQITFTVREGVYPPHTVDVDELDIHSPGLLLGETFTTPQLNTAGTFRMYCRPHEVRGHFTSLVVQAAAAATSAPPATPAPTFAVQGDVLLTPSPVPTVTPIPSAMVTLAPVGVGKASPEELRRPIAVDPDSLEGLTGRARSTEPWTRALWFLLIASVPIVGAAGFALRRELVREATNSSRSSSGPRRSPARSPRSSAPKTSGSGRTSRGRRR